MQCGFCTPGPDRRHPRPAGPQRRPDRRRDPRGARRQPVPLHGLREDPRRGAAGGAAMNARHRGLRDRHRRRRRHRARRRAHRDRGRPHRRGRRGPDADARRHAHRRPRLPRHARARQLPPPPLPVGHARPRRSRRRCSSGSASCIRCGRTSTARSSAPPPRAGLAALARSGCSTTHRPPLRLPARRRRPARGRDRGRARPRTSASTRAAARWTSASPTAACRPTRWSRTATRSSPPARRRSTASTTRRRARCCGSRSRRARRSPSPSELMARDRRARAAARRPAAHPPGRDASTRRQFCLELFGVRPVEYLEQLGWLGDDVWLAHCVHLDEREVARFGETGTGVAHCPTSNARLGAGIAPVAALTAAGAPVGLGVDGAASNEAGELAGELRQALLVARLRGRPAGADRPRGARARHDPRRPLPRPRRRARLARARQARRRRAVAARRPRPRRHRRPGRGARARRPPAGRHAARRRQDRGRGRRAARPPTRRRSRASSPREPADAGGGGVTVEAPSARAGSARASAGPTASRRSRASSPTRPTCGPTACCGARRCAARTRARASARSTSRAALAVPGVHAVLTHEDVPGRKTYGLEHPRPAGAGARPGPLPGRAGRDRRRRPPRDRAPRGRRRSRSTTRCSTPLTDPERALRRRRRCTPAATCCGTSTSSTATRTRPADVVVTGEYEVGMQDQAFLGPESGLAVPGRGRRRRPLHRHPVAARRPRPGRRLPRTCRRTRCASRSPASAARSAAREDLSMQVHACLLALHTGRPVKMVYGREESFFGHVHRHPARMRYEHGATRDGDLVYVQARILLDGGAYASTLDRRVLATPRRFALRAVRRAQRADRRLRRLHQQPAVRRDARLRRRPDLLRARGADGQARRGAGHGPGRAAAAQRAGRPAASMPTGAPIRCPAPVAELLGERVARGRCPRADGDHARRASRTPPTARASCAASATPSASRTSASPRASTTTRPRACGCRWRAVSRWSRCTLRPPRSARGS